MHPVLWSWGPVTLYTYGAMLAIAVTAALQLAVRRADRAGVPPERIVDLGLVVLVGGIVGARAVYVAQHWPTYAEAPWEILRLDHGGLVYYGGLFGGVAAALVAIWRLRYPVWATLDLLVPSVALAQGIGRLGCFFNGCCYGVPTTRPWGVRFPGEVVARHPTQLYESAALLLLTGALLWRARRPAGQRAVVYRLAPKGTFGEAKRVGALSSAPGIAPGTQVAWYLVGYGAWRFTVEFLRGDNPPVLGILTFSQVVSVPLVALGVWLLWRRRAAASSRP